MTARYCLEMKSPNFYGIDLYNKIKPLKANMIDCGKHIYITGVAPYEQFSTVLEICLSFGVVECEVGIEKPRH